MFEAGVEYKTRDGTIARVYATDGGGEYPIHGAIKKDEGAWESLSWTKEGECAVLHKYDLTPRDFIAYINVYEGGPSGILSVGYPTRAGADNSAGTNRVSCIRVVLPVGQFDA